MPVRPLGEGERAAPERQEPRAVRVPPRRVVDRYGVGERAELRVIWLGEDGAPAQPSEVRCEVRAPDGARAHPDVEPYGEGYRAHVAVTAAGSWWYRFTAAGDAEGSWEHSFFAPDSRG